MAIGWMTVLKLVPWGDVIKNAPAVADGARKLWDNVGRRSEDAPAPGTAASPTASATPLPDPSSHAALRVRVDAAEAALATLHGQMEASSTLIKALAEQNTILVLWLAALVLVFGVIAGLNLAVTLRG